MVSTVKLPKLHPFQYMGAYKLYTESRFLLADEMGMFKTSQAILASNKFREHNKRLRTLVVCPGSVMDHWAREIGRWGHPAEDITLLRAGDIESKISRAAKSRWTLTHYGVAAQLYGRPAKRLEDIGFHHVILDEVHNAKNPYALRTRAVKSIADNADHLSMLSGTPVPNSIADLYMAMSLLNPTEYPLDPDDLNSAWSRFIRLYFDKPQCVKTLFQQKMLHRRADQYLKGQLPGITFHRPEVPLTGAHLQAYLDILQEELHPGKKIMLLEKASLDPHLVDTDARLNRNSSCKYRFLDELIEQELSKKTGKVLIFTTLKEGIVDHMVDRYKQHNPVFVTGDVPLDGGIRDSVRKRFQQDPKTRIMVATTTMNEGVDLTAATAVVNFNVPWTPAEFAQRYKRAHRLGEVSKEHLNVYMPYTTIPGPQPSIEQASLKMLDDKERVIRYLMSGLQLSREDLVAFSDGAQHPTVSRATTSPNKAVLKYFVPWRGIGSDRAQRNITKHPEMDQYIAELYAPSGTSREFIMAKNAADIYLPIIKELETQGPLEAKLDLACGPGMLGYYLQEPTIGIDISPAMLRQGKRIFPDNLLIQGKMHQLPLGDGCIDFSLCSLAFQIAEPKQERAGTLREVSRVLRPKGYALFILVGNYLSSPNREKLEETFDAYGIHVKQSAINVGPSGLEWYLLQKQHRPSNEIFNLRFKGDGGR